MTKKDKLKNCALRALDANRCLLVRIKKPGTQAFEIVINQPIDIEEKIKYYDKAYSKDLKLKTNKEVEIIDFMEYDIETHQIYYIQGDVNEEYLAGEKENDK